MQRAAEPKDLIPYKPRCPTGKGTDQVQTIVNQRKPTSEMDTMSVSDISES